MTVESALYPQQLNTAWPQASDMVSEGDNHIRLTKTVIKTTFPNVAGAVSATDVQLSYVAGVTSAIQAQIDSKGAIAGQTWTGTHVFPSTTTIGSLTPTIRGYLETVTSDAQAQINARAVKAGDTYSGTHDFTGATVTVPTLSVGATGNGAVSADLLNATAFAAALPGQAGNAGKFVKTDGTNASWAFPVLTMVPIVNDTPVTAAPGNFYIFTVSGATLNVPTTFTAGDPLGFGMSQGVTSATVDWSTNKLKGRTPGVMSLITQNDGAVCVFANATDGFMEAA